LASEAYTVIWREISALDWNEAVITDNSFELTDLENCTEYEFQIRTICEIEEIDFSASTTFLTKDCGACIDATYCQPEGDFEGMFTFIERIKINDFENTTGTNNGYANFVVPNAEGVNIGESFDLTIEIGSTEGFTSASMAVWIDLNANGEFDDDEKLVNEASVDMMLEQTVQIPTTATPGLTRMRVMAFFGGAGLPCVQESEIVFGEVEDYCLDLIPFLSVDSPEDDQAASVSILPNPVTTKFVISSDENQIADLKISDTKGTVVFEMIDHVIGQEITLPNDLLDGVYFLMINEKDSSKVVKFLKHSR